MSPISRNRKKSKKNKKRYIPKRISEIISQRHFFQCAWCGENLTDRHHIDEFSEGGEHSEENLILLCPNCHRDIHNNSIDKEELKKRSSTHFKNDRISGGLRISISELKVIAANTLFINIENMIVCNNEVLLSARLISGIVLISCRLYDSFGNLVLWMNNNRYWTSSEFIINSTSDNLEIINPKKQKVIDIKVTDNLLILSFDFVFQNKGYVLPFEKIYGNTIANSKYGIVFK